MNIEALFRNHFGPESAQQLAQVLGLDPEQATRLLDRIVRSQLETVAQHAKSDTGRAQILDAIVNLPRFRNVEHALSEQGGASSLQLAGELLSPNLLGGTQADLAGQLSRVEGVPLQGVTNLMNMSLPLLLSFLGQEGVNQGSITQIMSTIRGLDLRPRAASGSYVSRAAAAASQANAPQFVGGEGQAQAGETKKSAEPLTASASASASPSPAAPAPQPTVPAVAAAAVPAAPAFVSRDADQQEGAEAEVQAKQHTQQQTQVPAAAPTDKPEPVKPEPVQDADYSKDSVVSALLDGAAVPTPAEAAALTATPTAPVVAAPAKENPYRSETAEQAADQTAKATSEPELVKDTNYSKDSVVSALLDGTVDTSAVDTSAVATKSTDKSVPVASASEVDVRKGDAHAEPEAQGEEKKEKDKETHDVSPAALAAAAAAAGIGAGAVHGAVAAQSAESKVTEPARPQPAQPQPAGSPWKSAKPVVMGAQPSQATGTQAPRAVPASPVTPVPPKPASAGAVASAAASAAAKAAGTVGAGAAAGTAAGALTAADLLDTIREQFSAPQVSALAEAVGFAPRDSVAAVQGTAAVLLAALTQKGRDVQGAEDILKLGEDFGRVAESGKLNLPLLGNRAELGALEVRGLSVLDRVLDSPSQVGGRLGTALGTSGEQAGRLLALMTPFVLGLLGSRARAAGTASSALSGLLGGLNTAQLQGLLPEGLGALGALLGMPLFGAPTKERATLLETKQAKAGAAAATVAAAPLVTEQVVKDAKAQEAKAPVAAVKPAPVPPQPPRPVTPPPAESEHRGGFPWWLLLIPLLAGLGWYWSQNRAPEPVPAPTTTSAAATSEASAASTASTTSAEESGVTPAPGSEVASETTTTASATTTTGTTASAAGAADTAAATVAVTSPAAGETVPDTGFTMSGTGAPDTTYQLLEDGVSVGTFASDAGGAWQADVAAPTAGEHVYSVQDSAGTEVLSVPVTVEATEAAAACSQPLSLSLSDGETVNAPFRFGGMGDASGYQVRVLRGGTEIGTKDITLAPNCTWNYLSQPGGQAGTTDAITYEVRSLDDLTGAPLQTINLNVVQAGE